MSAVTIAPPTRLRLLDGLRFIAALSVVIYHFTARTNPAWGAPTYDVFPVVGRVTSFGSMGVELFFVISGFVITMSAQGCALRRFLVSRVIRLYPAYWAGVVLTGALLYVTRFDTPSGSWVMMRSRGWLLNLTMFHPAWGVASADGVYWTLWIELLFYGFIAMLIVTGGLTRTKMLALAVGWPLVAQLTIGLGFPGLSAFLQPEYAPYFGVGICLFFIHRDGWRMSSVLCLAATSVFSLWEAGAFMPGWIRGWTPLAPDATGTTLAAVVIIGLVAAVSLVPALRRVDWHWLTVLGSLTYPLYIIHDIWGWWLISQIRQVVPTWATLICALVLVVGMAAGIHYFVERPIARGMKRWAARDAALGEGERAGLPALRLPRRTLRPVERSVPVVAGPAVD